MLQMAIHSSFTRGGVVGEVPAVLVTLRSW